MKRLQYPSPNSSSRAPVVVVVCSVGVVIIGLIGPIFMIVLLRARAGDNLYLEPNLATLSLLVAAGSLASLMVAIQYWRCRSSGVYLHILALVLQIPILVGISGLGIGVAVTVISLAILAVMAIFFKAKPVLTSLIIGLGLAFASFFFQRMGPEIGQYGNVCVPMSDCFGPLLSGGFPLAYMINQPGHTFQYSLDQWDEFRLASFVLDTFFYVFITYGGFKLVQRYRIQKKLPGKAD